MNADTGKCRSSTVGSQSRGKVIENRLLNFIKKQRPSCGAGSAMQEQEQTDIHDVVRIHVLTGNSWRQNLDVLVSQFAHTCRQ